MLADRRNKNHYISATLHEQLLPLWIRIPQNVSSSLHLAIIRLDDACPDHHLRIFKGLRDAGIGVQLHYTPVHLQPYYRRLGFSSGDFPETETYAQNAISLPLYPGLQENEQRMVVDKIKHLLK